MSGHTNKTAIPKFASFKPKAINDIHAPQTKNHATDVAETVVPSGHSRYLKRHFIQHHNRHHEGARDRVSGCTLSTSDSHKSDSLRGAARESDDSIVVDTAGDFKNLVYDSVHKYDVPAFYRAGGRKVLGAHYSLRINKDSSDSDRNITLGRNDEAIFTRREKYVFSKNARKGWRLIVPTPHVPVTDTSVASADFVALSSSTSEEPRRSSLSSSGDEEQQYRSIEGKAKIDSDSHYTIIDSSSDDETGRRHISYEEAARSLRVKLSEDVNARPHDIEAWIALIQHQDALLGHSSDRRRKIPAAERRSVADLKINLYERALKKANPSLENRERLLIGLMEEGTKVWNHEIQSERWNRISEENLDSLKLWKLYVDFRQSSFPTFRYDDMRDVFRSRVDLLREKITRVSSSPEELSLHVEHLIYALLRATMFMQEAGYSEVATAVWQAMLELNFCSPDLGHTSRLAALADFWESECPRIGEAGGIGWKRLLEQNHNLELPKSRIDQVPKVSRSANADVFQNWTVAESFRAIASYLPARTMDDVVENDPYRVILWSDIEGFVFEIPNSVSTTCLKGMLLGAFTLFCRLPPLCGLASTNTMRIRKWWSESFIRGELLECSKHGIETELNWADKFFEKEPQSELQNRPASFVPSLCQLCSPSNSSYIGADGFPALFSSCGMPFSQPSWLGNSGEQGLAQTDADLEGVAGQTTALSWAQNVLLTLTKHDTSIELAEYCLAIELSMNPQNVKKTAKGFLRTSPMALELYNAYAIAEAVQGHHKTACSVIEAALAMMKGMREDDRHQSILLWKTWLWTLLEQGKLQEAKSCLLAIPSHDTSVVAEHDHSPASVLRARKYLSFSQDFHLSINKLVYAAAYAECSALLEYLEPVERNQSGSDKGDLESALTKFLASSEIFIARHHAMHQAHELLLQSSARLVVYHVQKGPFRPGKIREHLNRCLSYFPDNTNLLSLYAWNESRLRIDDRVRTLLRDTVLVPSVDCITSRMFAIRHERRSGNVHSMRASFENAVRSSECRSSPGLWRLYILFCLRTPEYRAESKAVFYRAIRGCPWSKRLYIMAFEEDLGCLFTFEEQKAIYRVLGEKELRTHMDLEDFFEPKDTH